ncbi:hypothetical protein EPO34_02545 [Patescibacteria group bacterium]|nr:MAG: hypothetical protein EPO34_02545 [Patescibacteria group bacterium]
MSDLSPFSRSMTELRDAYRANRMAALACRMGTHDLRGRLAFACERGALDGAFLETLLHFAPPMQDPASRAKMIWDQVTPNARSRELRRFVDTEKAFGSAGVRMLQDADADRRVLYGPVKVIGSGLVLVALEGTEHRATMATRSQEREATVDAAIMLLFEECARGKKAEQARAFVREMGLSAIAFLERETCEEFDRAVAVHDDFEVSRTIHAEAVLVLDGDAATFHDDPTGFRERKIRLGADVNQMAARPSAWDWDAEAVGILKGLMDRSGIRQASVFIPSKDKDDPMNLLVASVTAARDQAFDACSVFVTDRSFCPDPLPPGGRKIKIG